MNCNEAAALITAYIDGESSALQTHAARRHLRACPSCAAAYDESLALRARIRADVPRFTAPPALHALVRATLERAAPASLPLRAFERWHWLAAGAVSGCAVTIFAWFVGTAVVSWRTDNDIAAGAVNSHVQATLGNQLVQVASSDRHTVKPWLSARLDYSPPVRDLAHAGFPLVGGRIDRLDGRAVATLVYRFRDHTIDVFVRPEATRSADLHTLRGFHVAHATGADMDWLAVSDVSPDVLSAFVQRLAREAGAP